MKKNKKNEIRTKKKEKNERNNGSSKETKKQWIKETKKQWGGSQTMRDKRTINEKTMGDQNE